MQRALLIVNPAAGRAARVWKIAARRIERNRVECDVAFTSAPGHARLLAANAEDYDVIFSLGGDGTAIEVIEGARLTGIPVGILAGGTGNLAARALGIPLSVTDAAAELIHGTTRRFDLGRLATGRHFLVGVGTGIDAAMIASTSTEAKRRFGIVSYLLRGSARALKPVRFGVAVTVDGVRFERTACAVLVANFGDLLHGLVTLGPSIQPDDGILNVCIFDPDGPIGAARIAGRMIAGSFPPDSSLSFLSGRSVTVETDPRMVAQADGDLIGDTPFAATIQPLAAALRVPRSVGIPYPVAVRR